MTPREAEVLELQRLKARNRLAEAAGASDSASAREAMLACAELAVALRRHRMDEEAKGWEEGEACWKMTFRDRVRANVAALNRSGA